MIRAVIFLFFFAIATLSYAAELHTYCIENVFFAPFNSEPSFTGELGEQRARGYNSVDETDNVVYSTVYLVKETIFNKADIGAAIGHWAKGQAIAVGGQLLSQKISGNHNDFVIKYNLNGYEVRKYARVIYKKGHFYQWSVQETIGVTRTSGKDIFSRYVSRFNVK